MVREQRRTALESEEQEAVVTWAMLSAGRYPELKLLYHIPNEGARSITYANQLKRMGLRRGLPDLCLPVARGKFHGLYIELKRNGKCKISEEQQSWINDLSEQGYKAIICYGADETIRAIKTYLERGE